MNKVVLWFTKLTGYPIQYFYYRKKIYTIDNDKSLRKIKGGALIVCNHTALRDFPLVMYTFLSRDLHTLTAEIVYEKGKLMSWFVNAIGGIRVNRDSYNFNFTSPMIDVLKKNKVGLVFPEGRIPDEGETQDFIDFKPSYVYLALEGEVPIVPIVTNGIYGKKKREKKDVAKVMIGKRIYPRDLMDPNKSEKENLDYINSYVRSYMLYLLSELKKK